MFWKKDKKQEEWAMVLNPLKSEVEKAELVEKLVEIFPFSLEEASQLVERTPMALFDDLPLSTASELKLYFKNLNVEVLITNDKDLKRKCFRVVWPKEPNLDFLKGLQTEAKPASAEREMKQPLGAEPLGAIVHPVTSDEEPNFEDTIEDLQKTLDTLEEPQEIYGKGAVDKPVRQLREVKPVDAKKLQGQAPESTLEKSAKKETGDNEKPAEDNLSTSLGQDTRPKVSKRGRTLPEEPEVEEKSVDQKIDSLYKELGGTAGAGLGPVKEERNAPLAEVPAENKKAAPVESVKKKGIVPDQDLARAAEKAVAPEHVSIENLGDGIELAKPAEMKGEDKPAEPRPAGDPKEEVSQDIIVKQPQFLGDIKPEKTEKLRKKEELKITPAIKEDKTLFDDVIIDVQTAGPLGSVEKDKPTLAKKSKETISATPVPQSIETKPSQTMPSKALKEQDLLRDEVQRLVEQNESLAQENQSLLDKNGELKDLEETVSRAEGDLLELNEKIARFERENVLMKSELAGLREIESANKDLEQRIALLTNELKEASRAQEEVEKATQLSQQLEEEKEAIEEKYSLLSSTSEQRIKKYEEEISELAQALEVKESERFQMKEALDDLNKRCKALNEIVEEYEKRSGEFQDKQQESTQRIKDLERVLTANEVKISKQDEELAALKAEHSAFEQKRIEIADKIRNLLAINKELMHYKESTLHVNEQLKKNKREFDEKLAVYEKELQTKSEQLNLKTRELEETAGENDRFKVEIGQMRNQIKSFTAEKDRIELVQKRAQLQSSISEKEGLLSRITAEQDAFAKQLDEKKGLLAELEKKRADIEQSLLEVKRSEKHILETLMKKDKPRPKSGKFSTEEPDDNPTE
jgi:septal ring factor EnvC (AmiA/AmiB activator)